MALTDLLYRCARCGHDPLEGAGDGAVCPECGVRYTRLGSTGRIRVAAPGEEGAWEVLPGVLVEALEARGGPLSRARSPEGSLRYSTPVEVRIATEEEPIRWRGEVLGYAEAPGDPERGVLEITEEALALERAGGGRTVWSLLEIRAVQTSSSSLQIVPPEGGLVHFRFLVDSPRRWEGLLHAMVREAYRWAGRGEVLEFQPRIVAR